MEHGLARARARPRARARARALYLTVAVARLTAARPHQYPMPPCCNVHAHCYKASKGVDLARPCSLLQGLLCLPVTRLTAARPHQCPIPPCYN